MPEWLNITFAAATLFHVSWVNWPKQQTKNKLQMKSALWPGRAEQREVLSKDPTRQTNELFKQFVHCMVCNNTHSKTDSILYTKQYNTMHSGFFKILSFFFFIQRDACEKKTGWMEHWGKEMRDLNRKECRSVKGWRDICMLKSQKMNNKGGCWWLLQL